LEACVLSRKIAPQLWRGIVSIELAVVAMAILMILVFMCTIAQVKMGTYGAVEHFMRHFLVWARLGNFEIPVFPGGALVGLVLTANLVASLLDRLVWNWRKLGLWLIHAGLILLFAGEFITAAFQDDMRMTIEEGQTVGYLESARDVELAIIDTKDPAFDEVFAVPATMLAEFVAVDLASTAIVLNVRRFFPNAELSDRAPSDPPPLATMGVGTGVNIVERDVTTSDDEDNRVSALVEPMVAGHSQGVWLVSQAVDAPQSFSHEGHTYQLSMRPRRSYLPYTISLKKFTHAVYPGTDIPKDFSSLVHISNPVRSEERDVLIYMNQPLRYDGKAFYQASFGKGDTMSILQVVENPGWLLPYVSCVLVTLGLLFHFALSLRRRKGKGKG
jgi:ResB-like family